MFNHTKEIKLYDKFDWFFNFNNFFLVGATPPVFDEVKLAVYGSENY